MMMLDADPINVRENRMDNPERLATLGTQDTFDSLELIS